MTFQREDVVVCVDDSPSKASGHPCGLVSGRCYVVREVIEGRTYDPFAGVYFPTGGVRLWGIHSPDHGGRGVYMASRFRKVAGGRIV